MVGTERKGEFGK